MKTLGKNIGRLRTRLGLTQEQLAEQLSVTRSSIARWENGVDLPKMAHLMKLAKVLGVSVNELTNTNINFGEKSSPNQSAKQREYYKFRQTFARGIAFATSLIVAGVAATQLFSDGSEIVGVMILMGTIIVAVPFYIVLGIQMSILKKAVKDDERAVPEDIKDKINRAFPLQIATGVALILAGIMVVVASDGLALAAESSTVPETVFLGLVAVAVYLFIYGGIQRENVTEVEKRAKLAEISEKQKKKIELVGRLSGVTMMLAVLIYVGSGLIFGSWGWLWFVFPIGAILCGVFEIFLATGRQE